MDKISAHKVASVIVMARELDRSEPQLRSYVEDMNEEEQAALVAVMWIGRGAFEADEWGEAYETAYAEASTIRWLHHFRRRKPSLMKTRSSGTQVAYGMAVKWALTAVYAKQL